MGSEIAETHGFRNSRYTRREPGVMLRSYGRSAVRHGTVEVTSQTPNSLIYFRLHRAVFGWLIDYVVTGALLTE